MNIAEHVCLENKIPVGIFSLEMSADSLTMRTLCSNARVNVRNVREGFFTDRDFPKLTSASTRLANAQLYLDDTAGLSILQLRARARRMVQRWGVKVIAVDYLQLLHSTNKRSRNRQEEIADISSGLKALAKELHLPVVVACQLNREMERDKGRRPRLSDLRESGSIEQDADVVAMLYRPPEKDDEPGEEADGMPVNLFIAKARNGPSGMDIHLTFLKSITRFESAAKVSDADIPRQEPYPD